MMLDLIDARKKYIDAYTELIRAELSYRLTKIHLLQVEEDIIEDLGSCFMNDLKKEIEECDTDE